MGTSEWDTERAHGQFGPMGTSERDTERANGQFGMMNEWRLRQATGVSEQMLVSRRIVGHVSRITGHGYGSMIHWEGSTTVFTLSFGEIPWFDIPG